MERTVCLAARRERLADLRHWHERSPSSYQSLPEMAEWLEEAWATIDALTADLDQAQRDLASAQAGSVRRTWDW